MSAPNFVSPRWMTGLMLLLSACAQCGDATEVAPPDAGFVVRPELSLAWNRGLPLMPADYPVPQNYATAQTSWRTATTAFAIGNYPEAGTQFMNAARELGKADTSTQAVNNTRRAARCMAYQNAAAAWHGHPHPEQAAEALKTAATRDPGCRRSIARSLERLRTATASTSTRT